MEANPEKGKNNKEEEKMNAILKRLGRAALATLIPQLIVLLPGMVELIPPPYNLILTPVLMGIAKGLRDGFPKASWLKYIPF